MTCIIKKTKFLHHWEPEQIKIKNKLGKITADSLGIQKCVVETKQNVILEDPASVTASNRENVQPRNWTQSEDAVFTDL